MLIHKPNIFGHIEGEKKKILNANQPPAVSVVKPQKVKSNSVKFKGWGRALYKDHKHIIGCCKQRGNYN